MKRYLLMPLLLAGCATGPKIDTSNWSYAPYQLTAEQRGIVENVVRNTLRDPQSAQFSRFKAREAVIPGKGTAIQVCGFVNAKNAFGGYVGRKPFAGAFTYDNHKMFRLTALRSDVLAASVARGCAQMGLI